MDRFTIIVSQWPIEKKKLKIIINDTQRLNVHYLRWDLMKYVKGHLPFTLYNLTVNTILAISLRKQVSTLRETVPDIFQQTLWYITYTDAFISNVNIWTSILEFTVRRGQYQTHNIKTIRDIP